MHSAARHMYTAIQENIMAIRQVEMCFFFFTLSHSRNTFFTNLPDPRATPPV